jgi:O-antigen/teichoic acid export membrane protein
MNNPPKEKSLANTVIKYAKSSVYSKILDLIYAYIKPKLLSPEWMGLWSVLNLILNYSSHTHLGSLISIRYVIPPLQKENKTEEIKTIKGSVYIGTLCISLFVSTSLIAFSLLSNYDTTTKIGLCSMSALVLLYWDYNYLIESGKAYQNFKIVTSGNYLMSTLKLLIGASLIYFFNIYGLLAANIIVMLITLTRIRILYAKDIQQDVRNPFDKNAFISLIKHGFPIMIFNSSMLLLTTVDRIIIPSYLNLEQLGYYSIAVVISEVILRIPNSAREVLEPAIALNINSEKIEHIINQYYLKPIYNISYYYPFLFIGVFFFLPVLLPMLLPRYVLGLEASQILAFGAGFLALCHAMRGLIVVNNWQLKIAVLSFSGFITNALLGIYFLSSGYGIKGVAFAAGISYLLLFLIVYSFIAFLLKKKHKDIKTSFLKHIVYVIMPFLFCIISVLIANNFSKFYFINNYVNSVIEFSISAIFIYAFLYSVHKRNSLVDCYIPGKS